jgi:molecular chaperone GrpE (heat shock protein)
MGENSTETSTEVTGRDEVLDEARPVETDAAGSVSDGLVEQAEPAPPVEQPELLEALQRLDKRLEESQRLLDRQQELADRLHVENQALRAGELRSAQLPLVRDILRLYDDVGRMRDGAEEDGDLRIVRETLVDTLVRNGVVPFEPDRGDDFDSHTHSVVRVEATVDDGLDRTVAEVVKQGFKWESGEVIRVAEVTAYRFQVPT